MEKLKNKKMMGLTAAGLLVASVLVSLLVGVIDMFRNIDYIFDDGFLQALKRLFENFGGLGDFFNYGIMIVLAVVIAIAVFLPKFQDKIKAVKPKMVMFVLVALLAILAVVSVFGFFGSLLNVFDWLKQIFDWGFELYYVFYILMNLLDILNMLAFVALAVYALMTVLGKDKLKKFWYAPAGLFAINAVLSTLLYWASPLVDKWWDPGFSYFIFGLIYLVVDLVTAVAIAGVGYWLSLPAEDEIPELVEAEAAVAE